MSGHHAQAEGWQSELKNKPNSCVVRTIPALVLTILYNTNRNGNSISKIYFNFQFLSNFCYIEIHTYQGANGGRTTILRGSTKKSLLNSSLFWTWTILKKEFPREKQRGRRTFQDKKFKWVLMRIQNVMLSLRYFHSDPLPCRQGVAL